MELNKIFFNGKTWSQILEELKFEKHLKKLSQKFKNKKIILYGTGIMLDYIVDNFDLSSFNIVAVTDIKYLTFKEESYKGYKVITPNELLNSEFDLILITTQYPVAIRNYLRKELFKNRKKPKIWFLLNKPLKLYFEEIFS